MVNFAQIKVTPVFYFYYWYYFIDAIFIFYKLWNVLTEKVRRGVMRIKHYKYMAIQSELGTKCSTGILDNHKRF